ncbi:uracil phosphoribosyltransferase [Planctomycetes bacterium Poly30]|uniref:Uracil phosphoribosyltransferase n=1 Tax=Saltatorellus ferox TaxID=2528018 RepID=A0A518EXS3_9BACT|nr:uracil phosphoribosyltransferase [Planctomycetes bacterium Poly30]
MPDLIPKPRASAAAPGSSGAIGEPAGTTHLYGSRVHIAGDPWTASALAKLSAPTCTHTELVAIVRAVSTRLATAAFAAELPAATTSVRTRMADKHGAALGTWRGDALDPAAMTVVIDVIRGGMIPAQTVFELLTLVLPIESLRLDHLNMQRVPGEDGHVERVELSGSKVGGSIEGATLILPDPMGATGATMVRALEHLFGEYGQPASIVMLPLIVTPEFLRTVLDFDDRVRVYAGRLDRGMSSQEVLAEVPGARWAEESGLDDEDYIVPGAGGVGELLNNSY